MNKNINIKRFTLLFTLILLMTLLLTACGDKAEWKEIPADRTVSISYGVDRAGYSTNTSSFVIKYHEENNMLHLMVYNKEGELLTVAAFPAPYILKMDKN